MELFPGAYQVVAVGYLTYWPRLPLSDLTHYDDAAAVEGIDCAGNSCARCAAARSSAVVEHRAAFGAAVAPSVAAVLAAFVIFEDVVAVVEFLALEQELDAFLQTTPAVVAIHLEKSAERESSALVTAEEIVVAVVANVVGAVAVA